MAKGTSSSKGGAAKKTIWKGIQKKSASDPKAEQRPASIASQDSRKTSNSKDPSSLAKVKKKKKKKVTQVHF